LDHSALENSVVRACRGRAVDWGQAVRVARLGEELYRHGRHLHGLTKTVRPLLRAAALLHGAGAEAPALAGRVAGLSRAGRQVVASALSIGAARRPASRVAGALARAAPAEQLAGRIAAVVRAAAALARAGAHRLAGAEDDGRRLTLHAEGASPRRLRAAARGASLWNALLARPIGFVRAGRNARATPAALRPGERLIDAVRRILQFEAERLFSRTYGLGDPRDPEYVHEMRVAVRRLRTALRIARKALPGERKRWREDLARLARALGAVRDADVLLLFLRQRLDHAPAADRPALRRLVAAERAARRRAARDLAAAFASRRCRRFRDEFRARLTRRGALPATAPAARRPVWKHARKALRRRFDRLASYGRRLERLDADRRHRLRIDCKRLRYAAEFFAELYPPSLGELIGAMVQMQDLLGEAHDAEVWSERIARRLPRGAAGRALRADLAERQTQCLRQAAAAWRRFTRPAARRKTRARLSGPRRA